MLLLVYSTFDNPRLQYTLRELLRVRMGLDFYVSSSLQDFTEYEGPKLNYSENPQAGSFQVVPYGLLSETGVKDQQPLISQWQEEPVFFATSGTELSFDIFSMAFYLLSRYEEYLPYVPDRYGRFEATQSLAYKASFLQKPLLDILAQKWGKALEAKFPQLQLKQPAYRYLPTFDIDMAYSYRGKGWKRSLGGLLRDVFGFRLRALQQRLAVWSGRQADPFDRYDFMQTCHPPGEAMLFFLLGNYSSLEKNLSWNHPLMRELAERLNGHFTLGIHPSTYTRHDLSQLKKETMRLEIMQGKRVEHSRQHFLSFSLPDTYRNLLKAGIRHDYSMGYAEETGFRASTASAFRFFDLHANCETELLIHPFMVMDVCLLHYKQMPVHEVKTHFAELVRQVKQTGGTFASLWHNESLSDELQWKGWKALYEELTKLARH